MNTVNENENPFTSFWPRRLAVASLGVSMILIGIWLAEFVGILDAFHPLSESLVFVIACAVTAAVATSALIFRKQAEILAQFAYVASATTILFGLYVIGTPLSPLFIFWSIIALLAGVYLFKTLLPTIILFTIYSLYLVLYKGISSEEGILLVACSYLPLLFSIFLWSNTIPQKTDKQQALDVLSHELSEVSNKSEIVINTISDGVIALGNDGIIVLINPAAQALLGWDKDDALHLDYKLVFKIVDKADKVVDPAVDPVNQCFKTGEHKTTSELRVITNSDKHILVSIDVSPVGEKAKNGAIIVFRDITTQVEENRERTEFVSTASHEMRTPVAAIEGYLGLALNPQTATIDDKAREYITKAHESAQHLGHLFQDLLDISKAEDGRMQINLQVTDIVARTRSVVQGFATSAAAKGLTLVFNPDATKQNGNLTPAFYAEVDPDRFDEISGNLIENAIKYTKTGSVTIDVKGDENHVRISVQDTGIGIPAEDIPHMFQKFYRVDNSDTREIGGTGLGLYLSRQLIESMGGQLILQSEYTQGSTFTIELNRLTKAEIDQKVAAASQTMQPTPQTQVPPTAPMPPAA